MRTGNTCPNFTPSHTEQAQIGHLPSRSSKSRRLSSHLPTCIARTLSSPRRNLLAIFMVPLSVAWVRIQRNARLSYAYVGCAANVIPRLGAIVLTIRVYIALHEVPEDNAAFVSMISLLRVRARNFFSQITCTFGAVTWTIELNHSYTNLKKGTGHWRTRSQIWRRLLRITFTSSGNCGRKWTAVWNRTSDGSTRTDPLGILFVFSASATEPSSMSCWIANVAPSGITVRVCRITVTSIIAHWRFMIPAPRRVILSGMCTIIRESNVKCRWTMPESQSLHVEANSQRHVPPPMNAMMWTLLGLLMWA